MMNLILRFAITYSFAICCYSIAENSATLGVSDFILPTVLYLVYGTVCYYDGVRNGKY